MNPDEPPWRLERFLSQLDEWAEREDPPEEVKRTVTRWIDTRFDDPYADAVRESGFPSLWYAVIPGSIHGPHQVVVCSFWISESSRRVTCDQISSLSYPAQSLDRHAARFTPRCGDAMCRGG